MQLTKSFTMFFWLALIALTSWACSESNFAGSSAKRQSSANLNGNGAPDAGDGIDVDAGDGLDSGLDSGPDGGFGDTDTDGGSDTDGDSDGDSDADGDSGDDEDDDGEDDNDDDLDLDEDSNSLETREDGELQISAHEDDFKAEFRYETDSGWSEWIGAVDNKYPKLCHKYEETVLEMRISGGANQDGWISPPHADIMDGGSSGGEVSVNVEDGGCALSFLCDGSGGDFVFTMRCPSGDVTVEGMF